MTRDQKIEALADKVYPKMHPAWDGEQREAYVDGILAGIALRDAELLAALEDHRIEAVDFRKCVNHNLTISHSLDGMYMSVMNALTVAQQKDEQFIKAIKGGG